eukprot:COSAG01_NODE_50540_length_362_cov_1.615970_1_plen_43_part_10
MRSARGGGLLSCTAAPQGVGVGGEASARNSSREPIAETAAWSA